jgi:hypothetical protein
MDDILYFEDIVVGDSVAFGPLTLSREETIAFAAEFDPQPSICPTRPQPPPISVPSRPVAGTPQPCS